MSKEGRLKKWKDLLLENPLWSQGMGGGWGTRMSEWEIGDYAQRVEGVK